MLWVSRVYFFASRQLRPREILKSFRKYVRGLDSNIDTLILRITRDYFFK